jgi:hypothetical protein
MNAILNRISSDEDFVLYAYGPEGNSACDGIVSYSRRTGEVSYVRRASNDRDGLHSGWLFEQVLRTVESFGAPETRFVAIG